MTDAFHEWASLYPGLVKRLGTHFRAGYGKSRPPLRLGQPVTLPVVEGERARQSRFRSFIGDEEVIPIDAIAMADGEFRIKLKLVSDAEEQTLIELSFNQACKVITGFETMLQELCAIDEDEAQAEARRFGGSREAAAHQAALNELHAQDEDFGSW